MKINYKLSHKISILGTEYTISFKSQKKLSKRGCDGSCDRTSKNILVTRYNVSRGDTPNKFDNPEKYVLQVLRHEVIHAFLYESGLDSNFAHPQYGHDETFVDWISMQLPKINKALKDAGFGNDL